MEYSVLKRTHAFIDVNVQSKTIMEIDSTNDKKLVCFLFVLGAHTALHRSMLNATKCMHKIIFKNDGLEVQIHNCQFQKMFQLNTSIHSSEKANHKEYTFTRMNC